MVDQPWRGQDENAADPATSGSATSASPRKSSPTGSRSSTSTSPSPSSSASSDTPSPTSSPTKESRSPSASPSGSSEPTAAELEQAITTYYGLVPGDTDRAWQLLTPAYRRYPSGGRKSYDRFWNQVDRVSVSNIKADPPSKVEATIAYVRGGRTEVDRTLFRLVRDGGVLKIDGSTVLSSS